MANWYRANPQIDCRLQGKLTKERVRTSKGWPKLKGKGAPTRHLAGYALDLAERFNTGTLHCRLRLGVCQSLVRFYQLITTAARILTGEQKLELSNVGRALTQMYARLAKEALDNGTKAWKLVPKFHLFLHICQWQAEMFGNPRFAWTYADEDLF